MHPKIGDNPFTATTARTPRDDSGHRKDTWIGFYLAEGIFDGDIGTIICALIPFAFAIWWLIRIYIHPAKKWKPPPGPQERTNFYRKKKVTAQKKPPDAGP